MPALFVGFHALLIIGLITPVSSNSTACPALLQKKSALQKTFFEQELVQELSYDHRTEQAPNTNCAARLNHRSSNPAACLIVRENKALLVRVPYGQNAGWDFPGGLNEKNEPACQTAEREVCEETGSSARSLRMLTYNVFMCELIGSNVCQKPKDEGFLETRWIGLEEVDQIRYRGGTWGDKKSMLKQYLKPSGSSGASDACGCPPGQGWSSVSKRCSTTSQTSPEEAAACKQLGTTDACGCPVGQGWSSVFRRCSTSSQTSPEEAAECTQLKA